jgi:nicotinamidase-related amidase
MALPRFDPEHTALVVVDMQEKLLPHMQHAEAVEQQVVRLLDGAQALAVTVAATEQYRKGLGATVPAVAERLAGVDVHEKLKFSACIEPVRRQLAGAGARGVAICGIEAHVCVLQTCLDFAAAGYPTAVVLDAIGSRRDGDRDAATQRLIQAGIVPTTVESLLLELVREAGTDRFKAVLPLIR